MNYTYRERPGRGPQLVVNGRRLDDREVVTLRADEMAILLRGVLIATRLQIHDEFAKLIGQKEAEFVRLIAQKKAAS